jgi:hypothetical protein
MAQDVVSVKNNTSYPLSFEATIAPKVVRASIAAGATASVPLPIGVTAEDLATSPEVKAENAKVSPNFSVTSPPQTGLVGNLTDVEILRASQAVAATVAAPGLQLGMVNRGGQLYKLRVISPVASAAGESWVITQLRKNGTNVLAANLTLAASTAARTVVEVDLTSLGLTAADGDVFDCLVTYTAGGGPTPLANLQVSLVIASI